MTSVAAPADRVRLASQRQRVLALSRHRLMLCLLLFLGLTLLIGARLVWLTVLGDRSAVAGLSDGALPERADIVDRNGVSLAQTFDAWSIGVHPNKLLGNRREVAEQLARALPGRSVGELYALLDPRRSFSYIKRRALPEVAAAVNAIGEPAIALEREPERLYPQTALASHVIGWTNIDGLGVTGMERVLDERLKDPALRGQPVALSIDSRVQAAMESELGAAMVHFQAVGASGLVLDVHTGELLALASLPSFNPNAPAQAAPDARFNRATLGVYELGSTFKPITLAMGLESGTISSLSQRYDATAPLEIGRYKIHDDHPQRRWLTVPEVLIYSSNIGTARIADAVGEQREKIMFRRMGFDRPVDIELHEKGRPLWPGYWGRTTTMTVGYGHGIAITPLHLASAYAALVNGGVWHPATLLKRNGDAPVPGRRVVSPQTSATLRQLLRLVVLDGTGRRADVPGYRIGGKTGTAEKAMAGGYAHHSLVTTFAGVFPMDNPRYVVIAMLDEPKGAPDTFGLATAAWNAAPVVSRVISRVGPMIGVYPDEHKDIDVSNLTPLLWKAPGVSEGQRPAPGRGAVRLGALIGGENGPLVTGFAIDHRKVAPGTIFGAFRGSRFDGESFIPQAVAAGAVAVVAREEVKVEGAAHVAAADPRRAFAELAAKFFAPFPETVVAVTGTNGKTSTVELTRQIWRMAGYHAASIGTLGVTTADDQVTTGLTTPDVVTFLAGAAGLRREGVTHLAFEASSHGLDQYRTHGLPVAAGAFTNLSRDHLDYHGTMEAYLDAKLRLFSETVSDGGAAVVWADDPASARVIELARGRGLRLLTVGEQGETLRLTGREATQLGQTMTIEADGKTHRVNLPLIGAYQAANALTAAGLVIATGGAIEATLKALERVQPVRGRLERAAITRSGAPVYVDYAHTPDGLEAAIAALRPHTTGQLIVVFGAGGDRDRGKRPEMGAIAIAKADRVIVTDDNPRSEEPAAIRSEILVGAPGAREIGDRRAAITAAIAEAGPGDIVLLAGKGHEQGQIVGDAVLPFDDVQVARECAA